MAKGASEISLLDTQPHEMGVSTPAGPSSHSASGEGIITIHPPANNNLFTFQLGVGLPGAGHNPSASASITRSNHGVYCEARSAERWARFSFYFYDYLLSLCVSGQLVVGAVLTALGVASSNYTVITVLGALNTGMAGTVALLKGQGLPNRPRQDWNAWSDLREYIEEREREIAVGLMDGNFDVDKEVQTVVNMYRETKASVERNRPDMYNAVPGTDGRVALEDRSGNGKGVSNNI
jgi:SMODS and SLOG-associating 2TM effector domain